MLLYPVAFIYYIADKHFDYYQVHHSAESQRTDDLLSNFKLPGVLHVSTKTTNNYKQQHTRELVWRCRNSLTEDFLPFYFSSLMLHIRLSLNEAIPKVHHTALDILLFSYLGEVTQPKVGKNNYHCN